VKMSNFGIHFCPKVTDTIGNFEIYMVMGVIWHGDFNSGGRKTLIITECSLNSQLIKITLYI
jgi:hypothetical protein